MRGDGGGGLSGRWQTSTLNVASRVARYVSKVLAPTKHFKTRLAGLEQF